MTFVKRLSGIVLQSAGVVLVMLALQPARADTPVHFGRHFPNGAAAVDYIYGPEGTWRAMKSVEFRIAYYRSSFSHNGKCDLKGRHQDVHALVAFSRGPNQTTSPDPDCHVLMDMDGNGEPDSDGKGHFAFQEHAGRGVDGALRGEPFNQFWFDDNWLARYMAQAYNRPLPYGLWQPANYTRWAILGGDVRGWQDRFWRKNAPDHIVYRGLHALTEGKPDRALAEWNTWLRRARSKWNAADRQYDYPGANENYWLGFSRVLIAAMIRSDTYQGATLDDLIQHSVSLRSHLLDRQERDGNGKLLSWRTDHNIPGSLINTETTALAVLGLGAGARLTLEAGQPPLSAADPGLLVRKNNILSARVGHVRPGTLLSGEFPVPTGIVDVAFYVRSASPVGDVARFEVTDVETGRVMANKSLHADDLRPDRWQRVILPLDTGNDARRLAVSIRWPGECDLDVAFVQVR